MLYSSLFLLYLCLSLSLSSSHVRLPLFVYFFFFLSPLALRLFFLTRSLLLFSATLLLLILIPYHPHTSQLKKWASRIVSHFIQRYGNPRYAGSEYEAFANYFKSNIASGLLGPIMNCLALKSRGIYVTGTYVRAHVRSFFPSFLSSDKEILGLKREWDELQWQSDEILLRLFFFTDFSFKKK